jgi:DNA-binding protein H-NS
MVTTCSVQIMAEVDRALAQLKKTAKRLEQIDAERAIAMRERDDALRAAKDARATWAELQEAAGLSAATITKALKR